MIDTLSKQSEVEKEQIWDYLERMGVLKSTDPDEAHPRVL